MKQTSPTPPGARTHWLHKQTLRVSKRQQRNQVRRLVRRLRTAHARRFGAMR